MLRTMLVAAACLGLAGCNAGGSAPSANLPALNVAFKWCAAGSPTFTVGGLPKDAKTLRFKLVDRDAPAWNHGGGEVPAAASIPCGAISGGYNGPNPPSGQVHTYEWTVTALNASGAAIASGTAARKYPE
ncbi:hypothetical protein [Bosea massiliensis]|uniref:Phospholipid-binding protein n=1 Tax=Bosea massiliensis TaxID=151419 RepID=A0ABW0P9U6_9HYPH